jgi:hypothetical protein
MKSFLCNIIEISIQTFVNSIQLINDTNIRAMYMTTTTKMMFLFNSDDRITSYMVVLSLFQQG